jgi:pentatricopeptide repeat protein
MTQVVFPQTRGFATLPSERKSDAHLCTDKQATCILQIPVGKLSSEQWTQTIQHDLKNNNGSDVDQQPLILLQRLVEEYKFHRHRQQEGNSNPLTPPQDFLLFNLNEQEVFRQAVITWEKTFCSSTPQQRRQQSQSLPQVALLSPDQVWSLVQEWEQQLPEVFLQQQKPDLRIYSAIMTGWLTTITATTCTQDKNNHHHPQQQEQDSVVVQGVVAQLELMVQRLKQSQLPLDTRTYDCLIRLYARAGHFQKVVTVMDEIVLQQQQQQQQSNPSNQHAAIKLWFRQQTFDDALLACVHNTNRHQVNNGKWADAIVNKMERLYQARLLGFPVVSAHYSMAIHAWAKSGNTQAGNRANTILKQLEQRSQTNARQHQLMKPTRHTYGAAIEAWGKLGNHVEAGKLMDRMCDLYTKGDRSLQPNTINFNILLDALAKSKTKDAGLEADRRLAQMWDLYQQQGNDQVKPDKITYQTVVGAWASSGHPEAARRAEQVFMEGLEKSTTDPTLTPDMHQYTNLIYALVKTNNLDLAMSFLGTLCAENNMTARQDLQLTAAPFNVVLHGFALAGGVGAGERAEAFLRRMQSSNITSLKPDVISYSSVIDAYAKSAQNNSGLFAEMLLKELEDIAESDHTMRPDIEIYNTVINAWARSGSRDAGFRAEQILRHLEQKAGQNLAQKPNVKIYTSVVDAWAKSYHRNGGYKAEEYLRELETKAQTDPELEATVSFYTACIDAWSKSGNVLAGVKAEALLRNMEMKSQHRPHLKPTILTYSAVINAWAKAGQPHSGENAEQILREMEAKSVEDPSMHPNEIVYTAVCDAWAHSRQDNAGHRADVLLREFEVKALEQPGLSLIVALYSAVMNAWAKSGQPDSGYKAQEILQELKSRSKTNPDLTPSVELYTVAIDAWAKSGMAIAGDKAEKLLQELEMKSRGNPKLEPSIRTYTSTLDAWAKANRPDSGDRAEKLLRTLERNAQRNPYLRLATPMYNSVINAWARQGNVERCEAILGQLCSGGGVQPDLVSFGAALNALQRSGRSDAGERADQYLAVMGDLKIKPSIVCYRVARNCWYNSQDRTMASKRTKELKSIMENMVPGVHG